MILNGNALQIPLPADSIDTVITDPPYGLGFMGKQWDHGVPGVSFWQDALRVAKPGAILLAFGGTRTHHRLMCAIEDAGWMIRDVIMWVYGCLSDDTEILTADGWKHHSDLACGSMVMCYNVSEDRLQWESVQEVFTYAYSDTAYNIRSNSTDQLVSRNHRCLVERGGAYAYETADRLARQETVPVLEYLPSVPGDILADPCVVEKGQSSTLLKQMQRGSARERVEATRSQGPRGLDRREPRQLQRENEWGEQSSLEGGRDILPQEGQLRRIQNQVCALPGSVQADGSQGRLHNGAPLACRSGDGPTIETLRGGTPQRPQPGKQRLGQPGALCQQQPAQETRSNGATRPTLATVTPVHYEGVVWCVRVPTGAFVARRNGHVFVTGNSGFPKSHDIGKAIDRTSPRRKMFGPFALHYADRRRACGITHAAICEAGKFYDNHNHGGASVNWENGHNVPTLVQWQVLQPLLGLSDEWLPLIERIEAEREVVGKKKTGDPVSWYAQTERGSGVVDITAPATPAAQLWDGWGTALKPAWEPIIVAMKPLDGTFAQNALKWGVAGLWIEGARIGAQGGGWNGLGDTHNEEHWRLNNPDGIQRNNGRWPANLIHDGSDEVMKLFPTTKSGAIYPHHERTTTKTKSAYGERAAPPEETNASRGSSARFFYCAKASPSERGNNNTHPTVKPISLMRYLCRLTRTPTGGIVLDPFCGSGSTGIAAKLEGRDFIGLDISAEYCQMARQRVNEYFCTDAIDEWHSGRNDIESVPLDDLPLFKELSK